MANKRIKELRKLGADEMKIKLRDTQLEFFKAKMKLATGELGDSSLIWRLRKDMARLKGLLSAQAKVR